MKNPKLTEWFPASVPPARDGVYQLRQDAWARYADGVWFFCSDTADGAATETTPSLFQIGDRGGDRYNGGASMDWRGLAKEPK